MASIFTGLAFMHGYIVNRDLAMRLGREEPLGTSADRPPLRPVDTSPEPCVLHHRGLCPNRRDA